MCVKRSFESSLNLGPLRAASVRLLFGMFHQRVFSVQGNSEKVSCSSIRPHPKSNDMRSGRIICHVNKRSYIAHIIVFQRRKGLVMSRFAMLKQPTTGKCSEKSPRLMLRSITGLDHPASWHTSTAGTSPKSWLASYFLLLVEHLQLGRFRKLRELTTTTTRRDDKPLAETSEDLSTPALGMGKSRLDPVASRSG